MPRWVRRIALIVGTFIVTVVVSFFLLGPLLIDAVSSAEEANSRPFPTLQDWHNIVSTAIGLFVASQVWSDTKSMTRPDSTADQGH